MSPIEDVDYRKLQVDDENPRLPERLRGAPPEELAKFYYEHAVVSDLVQSMAESGFFPHEPMIVTPKARNKFTVVEGNRRLAALCIIHGRPEAEDLPAPDPELKPGQIKRLDKIPCLVSDDREAIRKFVAFRHISGPLTWDPEAKARFLVEEIDRAVEQKTPEPFQFVARAVGSKLQAVRSSYVAMKLLWVARDEAGFDIAQIQSSRFGVWLRLMSSPDFRAYVNFEPSNDHEKLQGALNQVNLGHLNEVLGDLKAAPDVLPILRDSRDATNYGRVLMNEAARKILRETGDLDAAKTVIDRQRLPDRLRAEARRVDALGSEVKIAKYSKDLEQAAKQLATSAAAVLKLAKPDEV
jgi:hypothetical protein